VTARKRPVKRSLVVLLVEYDDDVGKDVMVERWNEALISTTKTES
jgi:hypothetical protein